MTTITIGEREFVFIDQPLPHVMGVIPTSDRIVYGRNPQTNHIFSNVPHLCVQHSVAGFEFGFTGAGPLDFALNILEAILMHMSYQGERVGVYAGTCFAISHQLHRRFAVKHISKYGRNLELVTLPSMLIKSWIKSQPEAQKEFKEAS